MVPGASRPLLAKNAKTRHPIVVGAIEGKAGPPANLTNKNAITGKTAEGLAATATWKNQLGGVGHAYDAAGNLTNDGLGHSFTYDAENRIVTVAGTPAWSYVYDGDGRRVKKCSSCSTASGGTMYYQGSSSENMVESNLGGSVTFEYVFFNGMRVARRDTSANPPLYYFTDHLGSTSVVTDSNGVIKDESDYFAYGGEVSYTNLLPQAYKFNGKELDAETNLHFYGARYYGSAIGRFMTPDWSDKPTTVPYASFGNPQSLNLYSYVDNNPATTRDPDGHCGDVRGGDCDGSAGGSGKIVDGSSGQNSSAGSEAQKPQTPCHDQVCHVSPVNDTGSVEDPFAITDPGAVHRDIMYGVFDEKGNQIKAPVEIRMLEEPENKKYNGCPGPKGCSNKNTHQEEDYKKVGTFTDSIASRGSGSARFTQKFFVDRAQVAIVRKNDADGSTQRGWSQTVVIQPRKITVNVDPGP